MTSSASRKLRRLEQKSAPSASQALAGLAQVGDLASKLDQFVEASERMQELAEQYVGLDEIQDLTNRAMKAAEEVRERVTSLEQLVAEQGRVILRLVNHFDGLPYNQGPETQADLENLKLRLHKADEPR